MPTRKSARTEGTGAVRATGIVAVARVAAEIVARARVVRAVSAAEANGAISEVDNEAEAKAAEVTVAEGVRSRAIAVAVGEIADLLQVAEATARVVAEATGVVHGATGRNARPWSSWPSIFDSYPTG